MRKKDALQKKWLINYYYDDIKQKLLLMNDYYYNVLLTEIFR